MTSLKIKVLDDSDLRKELDLEYEASSQVQVCEYALELADHILELVNYPKNETIKEGFLIHEKWQKGQACMHDVRQISFKIHQMARTYQDSIISISLRVAGHAIATAHMKEHGMVASDYAIKVINLLYPDNLDAVKKERQWQIDHLKKNIFQSDMF